ncbi:MAG: hypothetical protein K9H84_06020 [Bacteroidales bacterium]|nr:hypothetical protein [Bacteroidales bacterium]
MFDYAGFFYNQYAVVFQKDSFYYIDRTGEKISRGFILAYPFLDKYTVVSDGNRFAFIDTSFQIKRNKWFKRAFLFQRGYAVAETERYKFLLNKQGRLMRVSNSYKIPVQGEVLDVAERMPYFPGGPEYFSKYLQKKLEGNILNSLLYVAFVVEKDGSLSKISVLGNADQQTKDDIRKVLSEMPPWVPGQESGEVVRVQMNIPLFAKQRQNR